MEKTSRIQAQNITKIFGNAPQSVSSYIEAGWSKQRIFQETGQLVALRDISFSVNEGEIFVIMGLSGSGKSTLLRCVNRLHDPTHGSITIEGTDITALSTPELRTFRRNTLGMVFQHFALFPTRTVLENVTFGLEIQGISKRERDQRGMQVLETVGLVDYAHKKTSQLSGGMQQRVGLARALAIDPDILLMDEPFSALDPLIRSGLQDELLKLHAHMSKTILFVTHDLNEAVRVGDRIAIVNQEGQISQIAPPEDILLHPADDYVARFLKDVDRPSVVRLETIMRQSETTYTRDPNWDMLRKRNVSHVFMLDESDVPLGVYYTANGEQADLASVHVLRQQATIRDVLPYILPTNDPIAVVDEHDRFVGEVSRSDVVEILSANQESYE